MSNPQVLAGSGATTAAVLPNTGAFQYVVIAGAALAAIGIAILAVQYGKSIAARKAAK